MELTENFLKYGFFVKENYINEKDLKNINLFFEEYFDEKENYENNTVKFIYEKLYKFQHLNIIEKNISRLLKKIIKYPFSLRNIWMMQSKMSNCNKKELPFLPHIDKKRYLKVFLYLNDVENKDGPFTICTNSSPLKNELLRKNWHSSNKSAHGLTISDNISLTKLIYKKGTIICFDTNVPHCAGEILENGCRKVLRFNYFYSYNSRLNLKFFGMKLKKNIVRFKNKILNN